jgi:hypothetical protein
MESFMEKLSITLEPENYKLVSEYSLFGIKDSADAVNSAQNLLNTSIRKQQLVTSAELYLEEYHKNNEMKDLTESALFDYRD